MLVIIIIIIIKGRGVKNLTPNELTLTDATDIKETN